MILRRLRAEGFMRYRRLDVGALPSEGTIAIVGDNESGKSTLGEALSFALFGRSVRSERTDPSQLVSWDADQARVEAELDLGAGRTLRIARAVDKRGGHLAEARSGEGTVLADGPQAVDALVARELRIGFGDLRHSLLLAQQEIDLLRVDGEGEGGDAARRAVERAVGIADLERTRASLADEVQKLRRAHAQLSAELRVAEALAAEDPIDPEAAAALEAEALRWERQRSEAERALPSTREHAARLRASTLAARAAGNAFTELRRSLAARAAEKELARVGAELASLQRGIERELRVRDEELVLSRAKAGRIAERLDQIIDYRTAMAQLEARLDLYKNEVRRSLEAPDVSEQDLKLLSGIALPKTPAAAARLAELRVGRTRKARNRAITRTTVFLILAVLFGFIGFPAFSKLMGETRLRVAEAIAESDALSGFQKTATGMERAIRAFGVEPTRTTWLVLAGVGVTGLGCGVLLFGLSLSQALSKSDALKLSTERHAALTKEVEALRAELTLLEDVSLRRPAEFDARVHELRNPLFREAIEGIRVAHPELLASPEQGEALVKAERRREAECRELTRALEERVGALARLRHAIPEGLPASSVAPAEVPTDLRSFERRIEGLTASYDRARRDVRDVSRGGGDARVAEHAEALRVELARALERGEASAPGFDIGQVEALLERASGLGPDELEAELDRLADALDDALPGADEVLSRQSDADAREHEHVERLAEAKGRLEALADRRERLAHRLKLQAERQEAAARFRARFGPLDRRLRALELAEELAREAAADLRKRLGPMLARFTEAVLPVLTAGRYRRVRVSESLEIRVFSPDRGDFVPLSSLSMGATDQLLLTLRLAVGAALLKARGLDRPHLLFLDEPLASFDSRRTRAFLDVLDGFAGVFPQVFLVTHLGTEGLEDRFARVIRTELARRELISPDGEGAVAEPIPVRLPPPPADDEDEAPRPRRRRAKLGPPPPPDEGDTLTEVLASGASETDTVKDLDVEAFADLSDLTP